MRLSFAIFLTKSRPIPDSSVNQKTFGFLKNYVNDPRSQDLNILKRWLFSPARVIQLHMAFDIKERTL